MRQKTSSGKVSRTGGATAATTPCRRSPRLLLLRGEPGGLAGSSVSRSTTKGDGAEGRESFSKMPPSSPSDSGGERPAARLSRSGKNSGGGGASEKNCRRSARLMCTSGRGLKVEVGNGDGRVGEREKEEDASAIRVARVRKRGPSADSPNRPFEDEAGSVQSEECLSGAVKRKKRRISAAPRTKKGGGEKKVRQTRKLQDEFSPQRGCGGSSSGSSSWTYEQEMALRRAYLLAKPSPQFWKKISKMVPGRSAQECFDRMHSKLATPAQLPPRSRTKLPADLSPLPCGDLFGKNPKRPKNRRRRDHLGSKAVRQMLRKHSAIDQAQEVDLFSVLETSQNAFPQVPRIPSKNEPTADSPQPLQGKGGDISGGKKKILSRCSQMSPEVLRPVKNILLHERYIDQLHCREAARGRMHSERRMHCAGVGDGKENVVNSAKGALISDAREIIHQFGHSLAAPMSKFVDTDEEDEGEEEDEEIEDDA